MEQDDDDKFFEKTQTNENGNKKRHFVAGEKYLRHLEGYLKF